MLRTPTSIAIMPLQLSLALSLPPLPSSLLLLPPLYMLATAAAAPLLFLRKKTAIVSSSYSSCSLLLDAVDLESREGDEDEDLIPIASKMKTYEMMTTETERTDEAKATEQVAGLNDN
ncbi:hypothetical protein PIB30_002618 [Stylosanthes scabra]|uniref:Uncharacterized protein n=1 Tax=Stylosanthes scabra TaxID=79078 RepID=A0ABU6Z566_9FABA|nr:hypothetical protein [Stylosanthes scabra]